MRIVELRSASALLAKLEKRGASDTARVEPAVKRILADIRKRGDRALRQYAEKFDALAPRQPLRVSLGEMQAAWDETPL